MGDEHDPMVLLMLAREITYRISEIISCSICQGKMSELETQDWMMRRSARGPRFHCHGICAWDYTAALSSDEMVNEARSIHPTVIESIEQELFDSRSVGSE